MFCLFVFSCLLVGLFDFVFMCLFVAASLCLLACSFVRLSVRSLAGSLARLLMWWCGSVLECAWLYVHVFVFMHGCVFV